MPSVLAIERKKCGFNVLWITTAVLTAFTVLCISGGDLVNWPFLGFEVVFPFLIAVLVCEWVQTLSDPMIDVVIVHSKSLFSWVVCRFIVVAGISGVLCIAFMLGLRLWVLDFPLLETLFIFAVTTFFFSSVGVISSFMSKQPHVPAAVCGILWLTALMVRSLIRFQIIAYIYPFLRFADTNTEIWFANKMVLLIIAVSLWTLIYLICRKRRLIS